MPFGLQGSATFQRMMDELLSGLEEYAAAYLDDLVICNDLWEDHILHLAKVLD